MCDRTSDPSMHDEAEAPLRYAPTWGAPVMTDTGEVVILHRSWQKAQWYTLAGRPVGPVQRNVAPAFAYAVAHGWVI